MIETIESQPPHKTLRLKVEFEVLGKLDYAYGPIETEEEVVLSTIKLLNPTAHMTSLSTDLVDDDTYEKKHLDRIVEHHNHIQSYESPDN